MRLATVLVALSVVLSACKKETKQKEQIPEKVIAQAKAPTYPESLAKVFEKHGGIATWKKAKTMSFKVNDQEHTVDLHTRKTVVNTDAYSLGFDGENVWLHQQDSTAFKGNPEFYYNLYFYFYAMPFVLADDGIVYSEAKPLTFEGKEYPGVKISYKANVGTSPDDNYFIYYNPETFQMEWLGYTVTYFSKKPSDSFNLIKYDQWESVNGLLLPKAITWYKKDENGNPDAPARAPIEFSSGLVSEAALAHSFFVKPKE
ncbi:conserved hypothetical protein [Tenacibaculum litopenaei]|uniref:DUF6503 family protein n=1 Tax=Tenacibaculum litopenaei TaxID=396016 RepID=UPI003894CFB4